MAPEFYFEGGRTIVRPQAPARKPERKKCASRSVRNSVGIQENLSGQSALQFRKSRFEFFQPDAFVKQWIQIQPPRLQQRRHLLPRFVHAPPIDSLHSRAL